MYNQHSFTDWFKEPHEVSSLTYLLEWPLPKPKLKKLMEAYTHTMTRAMQWQSVQCSNIIRCQHIIWSGRDSALHKPKEIMSPLGQCSCCLYYYTCLEYTNNIVAPYMSNEGFALLNVLEWRKKLTPFATLSTIQVHIPALCIAFICSQF